MDPATLAGIGIAFVALLIMMLMEGSSPASLFLLPPLILVFVASFGAALATGTLADGLAVPKMLQKALLAKVTPPDATVATLVSLAEKARKEGLLSLEEAAKDIEDPFFQDGLQLAIDGTDPEELREVLYAKIDSKKAADKAGAKFFNDMGGYAPTIGIVGTVVGLVHVLESLSEPDKLGHLIAAAFLATLWGVLSANFMWLPIAGRLKRLSEIEANSMEMVVEGLLAIQAGSNPRMVARRLEALLPPGAAAKAKEAA